jgi:predicted PurR-regulated permease PerM
MNSFYLRARQHQRPIILVLTLVLLIVLLWLLRGVLLPFIIGVLLAWLLQPVIDRVERRLPGAGKHRQLRRVTVIIGMYLVVAAIIGLLVFYVATTLGKPVVSLVIEFPRLIPQGMAAIEERLETYLVSLPPSMRIQISDFLSQAGTQGGKALVDFITGGVVRIRSSSSMILGFVALPVFLFYLLKDWHGLRSDFYGALPPWALTHVRSTFAIVRNVIGRYLRAQLIMGLAVGLGVYVLLTIAKIGYALPLAVFAGLGEFVPIIGPWLAGIVGVLVVFATAPGKIVWVALGYIVIQLVQNNLLSPRVQGHQMMIHPALVIVLTILAASILGLPGFLIVLPLTMTIVEIVKYARRCARGDTQVGAGNEPPTAL